MRLEQEATELDVGGRQMVIQSGGRGFRSAKGSADVSQAKAMRVQAALLWTQAAAAKDGRLFVDHADRRWMLDPANKAILGAAAREHRVDAMSEDDRTAIEQAAEELEAEAATAEA